MNDFLPAIPNLPVHREIIDANGKMSEDWYRFFSQAFIYLQQNLSKEGYKLPQQTANNITTLNTAQSTGAIVYDADSHLAKVNINGVFKTILTA